MTDQKPSRKPPWDERLIEFLQRINGPVLPWVAVIGGTVAFILNRPEGMTFFGGLFAASLVLDGRSRGKK